MSEPMCYGCPHCGCDPYGPEPVCFVCDNCDEADHLNREELEDWE